MISGHSTGHTFSWAQTSGIAATITVVDPMTITFTSDLGSPGDRAFTFYVDQGTPNEQSLVANVHQGVNGTSSITSSALSISHGDPAAIGTTGMAGQSLLISFGTPTADGITAGLPAGQAMSVSQGILTPAGDSVNVFVTGHEALASVGSVGAQAADLDLMLVGIPLTSTFNTPTGRGTGNVSLTGITATSDRGTVAGHGGATASLATQAITTYFSVPYPDGILFDDSLTGPVTNEAGDENLTTD